MDDEPFPEEIRHGVRPLVFAVNAVANSSPSVTNSSTDDVSHNELFENFLEGVRSSLAVDDDTSGPVRVVAVSKRHAFPPSKDPDGVHNRSSQIARDRSHPYPAVVAPGSPSNASSSSSSSRPLEGVLPAGWLGKHAHACPSVLLVVTRIDLDREGDAATDVETTAEDVFLGQTLDGLRSSLAGKRECRVHLVCVVSGLSRRDREPASPESDGGSSGGGSGGSGSDTANKHDASSHPHLDPDRAHSLRTRCRLPATSITTLRDVHVSRRGADESSLPSLRSHHLSRLVRAIRDAADAYYAAAARRARRKLTALHAERYPRVAPLAARYCVKAATFHEFRGDDERANACREEAYEWLRRFRERTLSPSIAADDDREGDVATTTNEVEVALSSHFGNVGVGEEEEGPSSATNNNSNVIDVLSSFSLIEEQQNDNDDDDDDSTVLLASDVGHQCLTLASWLHYRIVQHKLATLADDRASAVAARWRRHKALLVAEDPTVPRWWRSYWCARESSVMAALTEGLSVRGDDDALSSWRHRAAAAEARARAGRRARADGPPALAFRDDSGRYAGGLSPDAATATWRDVSDLRRERDEAADAAEKAVAALEIGPERARRAGARVRWWAGALAAERGDHADAARRLGAALACVGSGWPALRWRVARDLIRSREKLGEDTFEHHVDALLSPSVAAEMDERDVDRARTVVFQTSRAVARSARDAPFDVATTFPGRTHAVVGDVVPVRLALTSKLRTTMRATKITVVTDAGDIEVTPKEGGDDAVLLRPSETVVAYGYLPLPTDVIAALPPAPRSRPPQQQQSQQQPPNKNNNNNVAPIVKARPRTGGLTQAGGAFHLINPTVPDTAFHGGTTVACRSLVVELRDDDDDDDTKGALTLTLSLVDKVEHNETPSALSRTVVDEDNYVAFAWGDDDVPAEPGPCRLRVGPRVPGLVVEDATAPVTGGRALEGAVHRVLLRLTAGDGERVAGLEYKVSSSTTDADGREAVVVQRDNEAKSEDLPPGWSPFSENVWHPAAGARSLGPGRTTHLFLDVFRPSPWYEPEEVDALDRLDRDDDDDLPDSARTELSLTLRYRQVRDLPRDGAPVSLVFASSVVWSPPLRATATAPVDPVDEGTRVPIRRTLRSSGTRLGVRVERAVFEESTEGGATVRAADGTDLAYEAPDDRVVGRTLDGDRARFALDHAVEAELGARGGDPEVALGALVVSWTPVPRVAPDVVDDDVAEAHDVATLGPLHGALPSPVLPVVRLRGPRRRVVRAPLRAALASSPIAPVRAGAPFDLAYDLTNRTDRARTVRIRLSNANGDVAVAGRIAGEASLGPNETRRLTYRALATRVGRTRVPGLEITEVNDDDVGDGRTTTTTTSSVTERPRYCVVVP